MELRPEVQAFAEAMERQLRKHDGDRGQSWKTCDDYLLAQFLYDHEQVFSQRVAQGAPAESILLAAADVGNFMMMRADVAGALPTPDAPPPSTRRYEDARRRAARLNGYRDH